MDAENDKPHQSRTPTLDDLLTLCRHLNRENAKYIVVGGMAVIQHGFFRSTEDIDLLIETSLENQQKVKNALLHLPDKAVEDVKPGDVEAYVVVRVADEIVIDLMKEACGIAYSEAVKDTVTFFIEDVPVPMPNLELLWRFKQTVRAKDEADRAFLKAKLEAES